MVLGGLPAVFRRLIGKARNPSPSHAFGAGPSLSLWERGIPLFVRLLILLVAVQAVLIALDLAFPPDMGRAERSSPVALDRNGAWLRALPVENGRWRIRADLSAPTRPFNAASSASRTSGSGCIPASIPSPWCAPSAAPPSGAG